MNSKVESHILENGLTILTKELHHVPLVSQWVWYRVGSRNEVKGKTGISHWVEHMQFKGTPKYPVIVLDQAISRDGGVWNAMTSLDWTTYFETLPSHRMDIALDLEADRMGNSIFDKDETELERTVVISEREGNENEPLFRLGEAVQQSAFESHPYKNQVIGELNDLKTISRDDLYRHYRDHYAPNHALIAIAGDFETDQVVNKISELYSGIERQKAAVHIPTPEPELKKSEKIEIEGPGDTIYLQVSYRSPSANTDDFFALAVLDSLLTGPSSLSMMGGGSVSNKTSRLYQALVEKDLAVSISGGVQATIDPYLYEMLAILPPEKSTETALKIIDQEITRLQQEKVSQQEIARAVKQAKALFAYSSESITNQAFWLGYASMFADFTWFETYIQRIEQVSAEQIINFAQRCLAPDQRIIGIYRPQNNRN
ncbi:MAG: insulinase family protein [Anaerolineaceae bacterium]|nr:insulinase family protein [Anaerolineaceae bacterium]